MRLSGRQIRPSCAHDLCVTNVVNINDVLDGHVSLDIACIDRLRPSDRSAAGTATEEPSACPVNDREPLPEETIDPNCAVG
jgi:hypothetical protein